MSQTRILCERCGFPQCYCACTVSVTHHDEILPQPMNTMTTQPSVTPRTDAAYFASGATMYSIAGEMKLVERELSAAQSMQSLACRKLDEAEKQLAAAKAECERLRTLNENAGSTLQWSKEELARLRAENERLKDHAFDTDGTPWKTVCGWWAKKYDSAERQMRENAARAERAELALANARCPNVVSTAEGTHHCALAESAVAALTAQLADYKTANEIANRSADEQMRYKREAEAQLAEARKDSERLDWLANPASPLPVLCLFPSFGWKNRVDKKVPSVSERLRAAIDAAMTTSNHKTT